MKIPARTSFHISDILELNDAKTNAAAAAAAAVAAAAAAQDDHVQGGTTTLPTVNDVSASTYQQLLEHTASAMLQPSLHANLARGALGPPASHPSGLLGWSTGPTLPPSMQPQSLDETNGERYEKKISLLIFINVS